MIGDRPSRRTPLGAGAAVGLGLALAGAGLAGCTSGGPFAFRGTTAASFLRTVEDSKDPNLRYAAYADLASPRCYDNDEQRARAAQVLAAKLRSGSEPMATRAVICRTLGMLRRPEGRDVILSATNDDDALVRAEACRALGRVGRAEDATILARVMTLDVSAECRIAAIESLGDLKADDRRITQHLVAGMEHDEPAIRVACWKSLKAITGKDLGPDALAWKKDVDGTPDVAIASKPSPSAEAVATPPGRPALPPLPEIP